MKLKNLFSIFCLLVASHCLGQAYCDDPDSWNYGPNSAAPSDSCLYFEECPSGEVLRVIQHMAPAWGYGTEIFITSTDFADTLVRTEFTEANFSINDFFDMNYIPVCINPNECYYIDFYLPEPNNGLDASQVVHSGPTQSSGEYYYLQSTTQAFLSHYRKPLGSYSDACPLVGCTDPFSTNYTPLAIDSFGCVACEETILKIRADFVLNDNISWNISNAEGIVDGGTISNNSIEHEQWACLEPGCYNFNLAGDAFNFTQVQLLSRDDSLYTTMTLTQDGSASFPFGIDSTNCANASEVYGCMNPLGQNYNPLATIDDGSCDLINEECDISLTAFLDTANQQIVVQPEFYATDYPLYIYWDLGGENTDLIEGLFGVHLFDTVGVYEVCATLYSFIFFENRPLCYAEACITIDAEEFGFTNGFQLALGDSTLGIHEKVAEKQLLFYPNPARNEVRLAEDDLNINEFRFYSVDGRLVEQKINISRVGKEIVFDVSQLNSGMYIVLLESKGRAYAGKLIVQ